MEHRNIYIHISNWDTWDTGAIRIKGMTSENYVEVFGGVVGIVTKINELILEHSRTRLEKVEYLREIAGDLMTKEENDNDEHSKIIHKRIH